MKDQWGRDWNTHIDKMENGIIYGHDINQFNERRDWCKLEKLIWITCSQEERFKRIGFENVPINKLEEFEELTQEYIADAIYYITYVNMDNSSDMSEQIINWILGPMAEIMNERKIKGPLSAVCSSIHLKEFLTAMTEGKFNKSMGKDAFREFIKNFNITALINNDKYKLADQNVIDSIVKSVYDANKEQFEKAKTDPKIINWLVGQVMKLSAGKAKAPEVRDRIIELMNR